MLDIRIATLLQGFAQQAVAGIQDNIRNKKVTRFGAMDASGQAAASVKYRLTQTGFEVYVDGKAVAYFDTLEKGRKPGKTPPVKDIRRWIDLKGIVPEKISKDSLAFLIARKIGRSGTTVFESGGKTGIVKDVLNDKYIEEIKKKLLPIFIEEVAGVLAGVKSDLQI